MDKTSRRKGAREKTRNRDSLAHTPRKSIKTLNWKSEYTERTRGVQREEEKYTNKIKMKTNKMKF